MPTPCAHARTIIIRFDIAGRITFVNDYGLEFFGYDEEELLGQPLLGTILPQNDLSGNDMRRMLVNIIDSPGEFMSHENENQLRNGDRVWIAWANKAIHRRNRLKEILAVGTDITERRRFEDALRESEAKHRMLAENVTDVIWGLDANLNFTYISPSDRQLRGYPPEEVLGRPLWEFIAPGSRQALLDSVTELEQAERDGRQPRSITLVLELLCRDGNTVWAEALCTILYNEQGRMVGMQGVCRDITDRIRIQALRDDVERMARHDLKTPLGAVISLPGQIAREGNLTARQKEMLEVISTAGTTMLDLVNRSLDLHKMETGTYELDAHLIDVGHLVEQIRAEVRSMAAQKGVSFALDTGDQQLVVNGEEALLHSMLSNLIKNAIEASPEGSAVSIRLEKNGPWCRVVIRNKGGVPAELRETFFDKYSRHNASKGSGSAPIRPSSWPGRTAETFCWTHRSRIRPR
ncbi:PAS domain-containing sensor histidine kinase [Salidesulfovibrio brasiliensis]|uniref:PAS domain-containing sensor histidine kinase n=1 Tax=Salidesulfovibrio brasiliensis TaxID=221711 RepID=UPI001FE03A30|nr:PAS domain-containing sensor histidine kinase [Salidesulfovibrio brasiliensis]